MRAYGLLSKDNFYYTNADALKAGKPSKTVKDAFQKAKGGLLFVDEAHRLGVDERSSKQAIGTLLIEAEAQLGSVQVILAGYPDPMQKLMRTDPGLQSRFPTRIHIENYTILELCEIAKRYAATKGVRFSKTLPFTLEKYVEYLIDDGLNARDMIRRTDAALAKRTNRLFLQAPFQAR